MKPLIITYEIIMKSFIDTYIDELYSIAHASDYAEAKQKMLSVAVPAEDASMIKAVADHFGVSLSTFCSEILTSSVREAFAKVKTNEERISLARKADDLTSESLKKQGISESSQVGDVTIEGSVYWRSIVDDCFVPNEADKQFKLEQEQDGKRKK